MLIKCLGAVALTGAAAMTLIQPANASTTAQGAAAVQAKANHWGKGMYDGRYESKRPMVDEVSGAMGSVAVSWTGTKVGINGWVRDTSPDGLGPVLQVGYRYGSRGAYAQRYLVKAPNGYRQTAYAEAHSLVPVWDLHARICTLKRGRFVNCTPWH